MIVAKEPALNYSCVEDGVWHPPNEVAVLRRVADAKPQLN